MTAFEATDPFNNGTMATATEPSTPAPVPYDLYSVTQYPWWCLNYFIIFWFLSNLVQTLLLRAPSKKIRDQFESLDQDKRNNAIIYVMQLVGTSIAFVAQLYGSTDIIFKWQETTSQSKLNSLQFALTLVAILYIWELIFRKKIGLPLLVHHLVTILLIQLTAASFFDTHDIKYIRYSTLMGFHATFEQLTFLALFFFRLNIYENWQAFWFFLSAAQSLLFKTFVTLVGVVYFCSMIHTGRLTTSTKWGIFWTIFTLPLLALLFSAQVYACLILYKLGKRCQVMDNFDSMEKSVTMEDEDAMDAELPMTKALFREESEMFLGDYETNQQSLSPSSNHTRSSILLDSWHGPRSRRQRSICVGSMATSRELCLPSNSFHLEPTAEEDLEVELGLESEVTQTGLEEAEATLTA
ncbi:expressed unknown protein [Seminavis robusta]|uniref:TLC domain-containing protein n=1 Tax=Seminavis robusta TaxID=568900 RepID=A0A9N8E8K8_9STRA|nr:expressed unknown protein [Seminavis robusta]|eukprot:Sro741_g195790.1 n/a (410) ;mRNA; f:42990-44219